jgi:hypothetical protein
VHDVAVTPPLDETEQRALLAALELAAPAASTDDPYRQPWRVAGLLEGVDDDADVGYAPSPRSTRGATRA